MSTFLIILLLSSLLSPFGYRLSAIGSVTCPIDIVYVQPAGESLTADEQQQALGAVRAAAEWWHDLSPIPTAFSTGVTSTLVLTATDPLASFAWLKARATVSERITVYVIDNSNSRRLLFGDSAGEAQDYYGVVAVVLYGLPGPEGLAATVAHELGHVAYGLDDLSPLTLDIMGDAAGSYARRFVGCESLAALGRPCVRVWLPGIVSAPTE